MGRAFWLTVLVLVLLGIMACTSKDQAYRGAYEGFRMSDQNRQAEDPSYDPAQPLDQKQQSYEEYKRERELLLRSNESAEDDGPGTLN